MPGIIVPAAAFCGLTAIGHRRTGRRWKAENVAGAAFETAIKVAETAATLLIANELIGLVQKR